MPPNTGRWSLSGFCDSLHRLGQEPPRHERQHLRRRSIQPLRIINHTQKRRLLRRLRQQRQHRQADQKASGAPPPRIPNAPPARCSTRPRSCPNSMALNTRRAAEPEAAPGNQAPASTADEHPRTPAPSPIPPPRPEPPANPTRQPRGPTVPSCSLQAHHPPPAPSRGPIAHPPASPRARRAPVGGPTGPASAEIAYLDPSPAGTKLPQHTHRRDLASSIVLPPSHGSREPAFASQHRVATATALQASTRRKSDRTVGSLAQT